jgi:putative flippase GtrA
MGSPILPVKQGGDAPSLARLLSFCAIGALAAAAHFTGTVLCVERLHMAPLVANAAGYLLGLATSYAGQSRLTFRRSRDDREPYVKFIATSLSGFALNSALFALLLRFTPLDYRVALGLVLVLVAIVTFLLMDRWVFAKPRAERP